MSLDIKVSKVQISKIIQSGGSFNSWLANLGEKAPKNVAIPVATIIHKIFKTKSSFDEK